MVVARRRAMTLEEFLRLPEAEPALEYEDGVVTQKMSPKLHHSALQFQVAQIVNAQGIPRALVRAFPEVRTTFAGKSYVPDISVFTWERIPVDADGVLLNEVFVPPDIAVEIASPGQGRRKLEARCRWYVEHGVRVALLVDPRRTTVAVFRPGAELAVFGAGEAIDLGDVIPGFALSVDELFGALRVR
jgi:Uma2 family endonuclease